MVIAHNQIQRSRCQYTIVYRSIYSLVCEVVGLYFTPLAGFQGSYVYGRRWEGKGKEGGREERVGKEKGREMGLAPPKKISSAATEIQVQTTQLLAFCGFAYHIGLRCVTVVPFWYLSCLDLLSPLPRYYHWFCSHYSGFSAVTADFPLSPSHMQLSTLN